jgi:hypothetical protein
MIYGRVIGLIPAEVLPVFLAPFPEDVSRPALGGSCIDGSYQRYMDLTSGENNLQRYGYSRLVKALLDMGGITGPEDPRKIQMHLIECPALNMATRGTTMMHDEADCGNGFQSILTSDRLGTYYQTPNGGERQTDPFECLLIGYTSLHRAAVPDEGMRRRLMIDIGP